VKICIVLGTRPEIIKMSPIISLCEERQLDYYVIHTGQHYSYNMDEVFFEQLRLPHPKYSLGIGSGSHGFQTGKMLEKIEEILVSDPVDVVLVQGDTNTVLAGSLAASKLNVKLGHVEAGLRSFDSSMPEEINRRVSDHVSDYLFAPTETSRKYLQNEGISEVTIHVIGNTVVDALYRNIEFSIDVGDVLLDTLGLKKKKYFLVTAHRAENVDNRKRFSMILQSLDLIAEKYELDVIYPIHPRSQKMIETYSLKSNYVQFIDPLGYFEFIQLLNNAKLVLTDSGGIQEESCVLGVPCVTLRDNTERPETIEAGSNILSGVEPDNILSCVSDMFEKKNIWINPYGDGNTSKKILEIIGV
jgi:UDP-N-acetylglucosamine 2-epimerase (non-hydrolysing)